MTVSHPDFGYIEKRVRKKVFGIFNTIDSKGRPHSTGMVFGVPPPDYPFSIYMVTTKDTVKVRNVRRNPATSFVVTFPHRFLHATPSFTVMVRGLSEILPIDDDIFQKTFSQNRVTRMGLKHHTSYEIDCVIRLDPEPIAFCYGLGINHRELMKNPAIATYKVKIPEDRL
jgi:hypothetical protein